MRLVLLGGVAVALGARRALSGVTASASEKTAALPGDDLVPDATVSMDRAATLPASPEVVWPWLRQLGKGRAGWYFPRTLDTVTPPGRRSLRRIDPRLQSLEPGTDHGDWGPGTPVLRVVSVEPNRAIVYHSLRDPADGHRWPRDPDRPGVFAMSWAITVRPDPAGCRLHLRVRARTKSTLAARTGDVFDGLTVAALMAGLRERIAT